MRGEHNIARGKLKGYLFEIVILELLKKNGFSRVDISKEPRERVKEDRLGFVELKGRGCWHQIDCPCDYDYHIPFSYPIRLLGEVKFRKSPIDKQYIREYIGVIRDIQENYFVANGANVRNLYPRKTEIGVFFSASGFQAEAEKLAYAHGIKTISYENNYLINKIKDLIELLESEHLSVRCMNSGVWSEVKREFINVVCYGNIYYEVEPGNYFLQGCEGVLVELHRALMTIQTSFIATTATGVFLHFVSDSIFPEELFETTDEGYCQVYYEIDELGRRYFWMELTGDVEYRRFYFTPPEELDQLAEQGDALSEKERMFCKLNVNIRFGEVVRSLILKLDRDWLDMIRSGRR